MLDQSFSAHNFETIFDIESRKKNINTYLSTEYNSVLEKMKDLRSERKRLLKKKKIERESIEVDRLIDVESSLSELLQKKKEIKERDLYTISKEVNKKSFSFELATESDGVYSIDNSAESFFAIKQLQYNIKKSFSVKQSSRHLILSQLKLLLNESFPRYVIRTDISSFFESIPQDKLLSLIDLNTILNAQSRRSVREIICSYESIKDKSLYPEGKGVPRGIGVSSYLSELYLKKIDGKISKIGGVTYYARYVDDIFILITPNSHIKTIDEYYSDVKKIVSNEGLELKEPSDDKCCLLDLTKDAHSKPITKTITYLGYDINISKNNKNLIATTLGLSNNKKIKIRERIEKSIIYFNTQSKYDIREAKRILVSCLRLLSTNSKLTGAKGRIKTGIYFSNDLLDNEHIGDVNDFNKCLICKLSDIAPHRELFASDDERKKYIEKLKALIISKIDFERGYDKKIFSGISASDMREIKKIWQ